MPLIQESHSKDYTPNNGAGMSLVELEKMLSDIEIQPNWRDEAAMAAAYYDGKQLPQALMNLYKERGQAPIIFNMVAPTIDGVLGMEAKTRTGWVVRADGDEDLEIAEGLNEKLNEAARMTKADQATAEAYAGQVKTGLHWVEVNKNTNPFEYPYRVQSVHRREIYWDWHAKRADLSDARYLVREKWLDLDQAITAMPKHKELLENAYTGWEHWAKNFESFNNLSEDLVHAYSDYQETTIDETTWRDSYRDRVRIFEVWYRRWLKATVMTMPDGRVVEYDKNNRIHVAAVANKLVKVSTGMFPKMRLAYYVGPHRIMDMASPLPHNGFPYIPFWGFREDGTSIPYGLIRRMMSPQDEINARRAKMYWLLSAKRVIMDSDATDMSVQEVSDEVQRSDAVVILNPKRQNRDANAFRVEQDFQLAAQQFTAMKDAEEMISRTSGVFNSMLGDGDSDAKSGIAISSLVEQGTVTLAELNDNYRFARREVGDHLLALVKADIGRDRHEVKVDVNKPKPTKTIILNDRVQDELGGSYVTNDVTTTKARVVLDDIQATAGYRAQISNRLFDLAATLPEDMRAAIMPIIVDTTDIPQREELVKVLRRLTGAEIDPATMSEEERAEMEARQQQEAKQRDQEFRKIEAEIEDLQARSAKAKAEIESKKYDNRETEAKTEKLLAEMQALTQKIDGMRQEQLDRIESDRAVLEAENLLSAVDLEEAAA